MSWRDGCRPRPPVAEGAEAVAFAFAAADEVGAHLDRARRAAVAALAARADATPLLADWAGAHRATFDRRRATREATLAADGLAALAGRLRAVWDEAAAAQERANRAAGDPR